ncbi:MAG TPA: cupin domain-containing protein [Hyphomonas sp.]|nr:cupin domain-containing protein [Hyphomonas sp.]
MTPVSGIWSLAELQARNAASAGPFEIIFDVPTMWAELFELPVGGVDIQTPHDYDELYFVIDGQSRFTADGKVSDVKRGDTIFVRAHIDHRFHDITEDLKVLVVFSRKEPEA